MRRIFAITVLICFLASCSWIKGAGSPYLSWTKIKVPQGTPIFRQGYRDGCAQLLYSRGNAFYRWRHKYNYNPKLMGNPEYRFGHKRGISFCFNFIVPGVTSPDRYIFFYKDESFLAKDYNSVSGMFSGLDAPLPSPSDGGLNNIFQGFSGSPSGSALGGNPLWAGGSKGQIFGQ